MPSHATPTSLKSIPLFADLDESKLEDFQRIFQFVSFLPGTCLMTQGHVADSIFFLESGAVEVVVMLPGGGEKVISTLGPGSVIGEMALLDEFGTRTATVRALTTTSGFLVERQDCRTLLMQAQPPTFTVQRRITMSLCQRLRELLTLVMSFYPSNDLSSTLASVVLDPLSHSVRHKELPTAYRKVLQQLPFFQRYRADEVEYVLEQAAVLTVPRGHVLFQRGDVGQASYIIVRGAVELVSNTASSYSLAVLGPGRLCGHLALIDGVPHETTAVARSSTVLLELPSSSFQELFTASTGPAAKFQNTILQSLLTLQAKVDNHLARMISQASIRTQRSSQ